MMEWLTAHWDHVVSLLGALVGIAGSTAWGAARAARFKRALDFIVQAVELAKSNKDVKAQVKNTMVGLDSAAQGAIRDSVTKVDP